jgi:hypothetical protein
MVECGHRMATAVLCPMHVLHCFAPVLRGAPLHFLATRRRGPPKTERCGRQSASSHSLDGCMYSLRDVCCSGRNMGQPYGACRVAPMQTALARDGACHRRSAPRRLQGCYSASDAADFRPSWVRQLPRTHLNLLIFFAFLAPDNAQDSHFGLEAQPLHGASLPTAPTHERDSRHQHQRSWPSPREVAKADNPMYGAYSVNLDRDRPPYVFSQDRHSQVAPRSCV